MENQEVDLNECPDCKKPIQNPYFIEGCGHLLCEDCAYRRASKWDPWPGTALNFNFSISIFEDVFRFSWPIKRNEYFLINNFKAIKVCFRRFSRRDLRPYDKQKLEKDTTSQVFFDTFSESYFETRPGSPIFTPDPNADPWLNPEYFETLFLYILCRKLLKTLKI